MTVHDDELDRLYRAAAPVPREDFSGLRAQDIAVREGIIRGTRTSATRSRPRRAWAGVTAAVASVIVATVVAVSVLAPQPAMALTPPPLTYGNPRPLAEVVDDAQQTLDDDSGPAQERRVENLTWGWNIDMGKERIEIVPQRNTLEWNADGSGTVTIIAGESFWTDDDRPDDIADSPYEPGEVIDSFTQTPEQFNAPEPLLTLSGSAEDDLWPVLRAYGADESSPSGELLAAITSLMNYWTLTDAQHATLIGMLAEADGVRVLGETRDRLGRPVVGLRVTNPDRPEYQDTVLISQQTGRIVGLENELTEPLDFIPAGVIGYTLWDIDGP